jgi:hypothetical protein
MMQDFCSATDVKISFRGPEGMPDFFNLKILIWVNFRGPCNGTVSIFYGHLVYFTAI